MVVEREYVEMIVDNRERYVFPIQHTISLSHPVIKQRTDPVTKG